MGDKGLLPFFRRRSCSLCVFIVHNPCPWAFQPWPSACLPQLHYTPSEFLASSLVNRSRELAASWIWSNFMNYHGRLPARRWQARICHYVLLLCRLHRDVFHHRDVFLPETKGKTLEKIEEHFEGEKTGR
jgi:hypothetical protein